MTTSSVATRASEAEDGDTYGMRGDAAVGMRER